jgi:hypothetical protein
MATVTPALSIVIPTDRWGTVRAAAERMCRQTVAGRLELVLVTPDTRKLRADMGNMSELAAVRFVEVASIHPLAAVTGPRDGARAAERGHRVYFQPAARIDLVNLSRLGPRLHERWLAGLLVAGNRRARWSWGRCLVYTCAAPLISFVLLARTAPAVRAAARRGRRPVGAVSMMVLGEMVHGAGEMVGYARGAGNAAERQMTEYEVHRLAYLAGGEP